MKYDDLRSVGHNMASSLGSGIGLLVGMYEIHVFAEAARSKEGFMTVDFLNGTISGAEPSPYLIQAVKRYQQALPRLCAKHGVPVAAFTELTATYKVVGFQNQFSITVSNRAGRRTVTDYLSPDGQRVKFLDHEGRLRSRPLRRTM